jgi:hypothetical protein
MEMPKIIEDYLFAPCGMNCLVCYVHLKNKKPCNGCLGSEDNKPERCKICNIKNCAHERGYSYCYECVEFPCKNIKNLEKSYKTRYATSLIENSISVKMNGINKFQKTEKTRWICKKCNGVLSLHDGICSECGEKGENYFKILKNKEKET